MIIDEPFPRHLNEVSRFPQIYKGGKSKRRYRRKTRSTKRGHLCKMCKSRPCKCKSCKKCMKMKCKCKRCTKRCSRRKS